MTDSERSTKILEAAIREFITSGEPVSSDILYERYRFGIKPASIRSELLRLTNDGLLAQRHTSGGRVPTEKGYQVLVNHLLEHMHDDKAESGKPLQVEPKLMQRDLPSFVDEVASEFKMLSVGYASSEHAVYKSGLDELCERIDFENREEFLEVVRDFEALDAALESFMNSLAHAVYPSVFIGGASPITKSHHLAIIADVYEVGGQEVMIAAVGPKRMDYAKPLRLFKAMRKKFKK
jgi:transcriptional regulator of heat shock response